MPLEFIVQAAFDSCPGIVEQQASIYFAAARR